MNAAIDDDMKSFSSSAVSKWAIDAYKKSTGHYFWGTMLITFIVKDKSGKKFGPKAPVRRAAAARAAEPRRQSNVQQTPPPSASTPAQPENSVADGNATVDSTVDIGASEPAQVSQNDKRDAQAAIPIPIPGSSLSGVESSGQEIRSRRPSISAPEDRAAKRRRTTTRKTTTSESTQPVPATETTSFNAQPPEPEIGETSPPPEETVSQETVTTHQRKSQSQSTKSTLGGRRRRSRRQREPTPQGAESVKIAPTTMKMSELCKDLRTGKMSKREIELRKVEAAEMERKHRGLLEGENVSQTPAVPNQNGDDNAATPPPEQQQQQQHDE